MLKTILEKLRNDPSAAAIRARRAATRHKGDNAVIQIKGRFYPVVDWSFGGVQFECDTRLFSLDQDIDFALKFRIGHTVEGIHHSGRIIRKNKNRIAIKFAPLSFESRQKLEDILEKSQADILDV